MSLTSSRFFLFLLVTVILFYILKPVQKYVLLAASLFFYLAISPGSKASLCIIIALIGLVTYISTNLMERLQGKLKGTVAFLSIASLIVSLFMFKLAYNVVNAFTPILHLNSDFSWLQFGAVVGLSYYTLTAIGYIVDVYWGTVKASRNIAEVFLFIFFFPQLISGPITRFGEMREQFAARHSFDMDRFMFGVRRMAWGYFKKLVISERFGMVVDTVFTYYTDFSLTNVIVAALCYSVQLYTDFSGCMDIIMGAAMLLGIELPDNFNAPFFSESVQEFWQRWHITLGTWFKDYVMYPLQKSKLMQSIGKRAKKVFGKKPAKKIPFYLSLAVLWCLIGLWHGGTLYYFIGSGVLPGSILILSDLCQPLLAKLTKGLHIDTGRASWRWFRRVRTIFLISMCWMVLCSNGTRNYIDIVKHSLSMPINYASFNDIIELIKLSNMDILLMAVGVVVLFLAEVCAFKGKSIHKVLDEQNYLIKVGVVYAEIITIMMYGLVGSSSFIYFQF